MSRIRQEGGCYCKGVRYPIDADPMMKLLCHCRECQYISGGGVNVAMVVSEHSIAYTRGDAKQFTRPDLERPVTREFCPDCGTHLLTRAPGMGKTIVLKVGTLDDPSAFGQAEMSIYTDDRQPFQHLADGIPSYGGFPPMPE